MEARPSVTDADFRSARSCVPNDAQAAGTPLPGWMSFAPHPGQGAQNLSGLLTLYMRAVPADGDDRRGRSVPGDLWVERTTGCSPPPRRGRSRWRLSQEPLNTQTPCPLDEFASAQRSRLTLAAVSASLPWQRADSQQQRREMRCDSIVFSFRGSCVGGRTQSGRLAAAHRHSAFTVHGGPSMRLRGFLVATMFLPCLTAEAYNVFPAKVAKFFHKTAIHEQMALASKWCADAHTSDSSPLKCEWPKFQDYITTALPDLSEADWVLVRAVQWPDNPVRTARLCPSIVGFGLLFAEHCKNHLMVFFSSAIGRDSIGSGSGSAGFRAAPSPRSYRLTSGRSRNVVPSRGDRASRRSSCTVARSATSRRRRGPGPAADPRHGRDLRELARGDRAAGASPHRDRPRPAGPRRARRRAAATTRWAASPAGLRDLLLALGHERATLVGHSLGGGVAMQFAYQFPEMVERLVLVSSGGLGPEVSPVLRAAALPGADLFIAATAGRRRAGRLARSAAASARSACARRRRRRGRPRLRVARPTRERRKAFLATLRSVVGTEGQRVAASTASTWPRTLPVLIVWGARDPIIPVAPRRRRPPQPSPAADSRSSRASATCPSSRRRGRFIAVLERFLAETEPARVRPRGVAGPVQDGLSRSALDRNAPDRIRTCDLSLRRRTLYPAELRALGASLASGGEPRRVGSRSHGPLGRSSSAPAARCPRRGARPRACCWSRGAASG